jgi:hypothetical protein
MSPGGRMKRATKLFASLKKVNRIKHPGTNEGAYGVSGNNRELA